MIALIIAGLMIYLANGKGKVAQAILKVIGGLLFLAIIGALVVVAIAIVSALGVIKTLIVLAFLGLVFLLMLTHSLYELIED